MKSESVDVFALHGFLGSKEDWKSVFHYLREEKPRWKLHAIDLFLDFNQTAEAQHLNPATSISTSATPISTMDDWALCFNSWVLKNTSQSSRRILVGYSMGGRLALHALEKNPTLWSGAVFLSTNPGLSTPQEKQIRIDNDKNWAKRFANEEFSHVLADWNSQSVFKNSSEPARNRESSNLKKIEQALLDWSLGNQKNFREVKDLWSLRQVWAAGEKDTKFSELLKTLPTSEQLQKWVIEEVSHRLLFEAPQEVAHFIVRVGSPIIG